MRSAITVAIANAWRLSGNGGTGTIAGIVEVRVKVTSCVGPDGLTYGSKVL